MKAPDWTTGLTAYREADAAFRDFIARHYDAPPEVKRDFGDEEAEDMCLGFRMVRMERMWALLRTPAPDLPALLAKMEAAWLDAFRDVPDLAPHFAPLLEDVRRLSAKA